MFKALLKAKIDEQQALVNKALAEQRGMNDEEQDKFNALQTEIEGLEKTIEAANKLDDQQTKMNTAVNKPAHVDVGANRAAEKPFNSFGEFLQCVRAAAEPGVQPNDWDTRLKWQNAATGIGSSPSDGGFLVQRDVATEIVSHGYEQSVLAPLCRKVPIGEGSDGLSVNIVDESSRATGSRWGGVQMFWRGEGDTVAASKPKFARMDVPLEDLMGLCYVTREMMRDAVQLGSIVEQAFSEEIAWMLDEAIIDGSGVGKPLGIKKSPALITVAKENGQPAATIQTTNLSKMWARLWARSRMNAVWVYNQDIEPQLDELAIIAGTGALEPRFITYSPEGVLRIKGRPTVALEQAATLGTVGDIMLADFSQYVLIDKDAVEMAESIHVRFIYGENVFRFMYRVNGKPYWQKALTPANGSNTQSPYIALATRA
jgi:HK97 family phage major capsid protein